MNPEEYMVKAKRAISSAKMLLDDGDIDGACNRAYYAMFDAAHAAGADLSGPEYQQETPTAQDISVSAERIEYRPPQSELKSSPSPR